MPLLWTLNFQIDDDVPASDVACKWISPTWFDLRGHYPKKMRDAANTTIQLAQDALKTETTARKELHGIYTHRRLSALTDDVRTKELHQLLGWITLNEPHDLNVTLFRYTKDDWSDAVKITEATFKKVRPIGQRFYGDDYIFDFQLGGGVDWEDSE